MDIHRCRFVPYPPSPINALAFSHPSDPFSKSKTPQTLRLAVGRANGDIEIWNPLKSAWFQETLLRGGQDRSIEGLLWTHDPDDVGQNGVKSPGNLRLFSIGYSTAVTEWNLATGRPARHSTGNYGEIWCMAAQPRMNGSVHNEKEKSKASIDAGSGQYQGIAVGCADGSIVLLSTADGDLQFRRTVARSSKKKARVLSIIFKDPNVIVAGHADSTIRVYDIRNNQLLRSLSLGAGPIGGPKEILVWSVKCTSDGTIVSGDSTGTVRFWDGKHYSLLQRIEGHVADVLDLTVSADGECVFSGGMDRRTTVYRRTSNKKGDAARWKEIAHQRLHKHDVKVMASYENKNMSIVASGGLDTIPIITPLREFGREHHRSLANLPQQPSVCGSPRRRFLVTWWEREISVWKFSKPSHGLDALGNPEQSAGDHPSKLVSKIELQGEESLCSVDLSTDGSLLAASTLSTVRIFRLRQRKGKALKVQRLELPSHLTTHGARLIRFSPDQKWLLIVNFDNIVRLLKMVEGEAKSKDTLVLEKGVHLSRLPRANAKTDYRHGTLGEYDRTICRAAFSNDSRVLAIGDLSGYIDTWVLEGQEDLTQDSDETANGIDKPDLSDDTESEADEEAHPTAIFGQHWIRNPAAAMIPKLRAAILVLTFRPSVTPSPDLTKGNIALHPTRHNPHPHGHELPHGEDRLFAVTSEHQVHEFEVLAGRLSDWSRRNPISSFPEKFRDTRERAMGAIWDVGRDKQRIWLYGSTWLWMFNLSANISSVEQGVDEETPGASRGQKRKRKAEEDFLSGSLQDARGHDTGAGSRIHVAESTSGLSRKMRKTTGADSNESEVIDLFPEPHLASGDDDDDAVDDKALIRLRRNDGEKALVNGGTAVARPEMQTNAATDVIQESGGAEHNRPYWFTYTYRSILGMVPLSRGGFEAESERAPTYDGDVGDGNDRLEVALVERPSEEVDLAPRYHGDQEWNGGT